MKRRITIPAKVIDPNTGDTRETEYSLADPSGQSIRTKVRIDPEGNWRSGHEAPRASVVYELRWKTLSQKNPYSTDQVSDDDWIDDLEENYPQCVQKHSEKYLHRESFDNDAWRTNRYHIEIIEHTEPGEHFVIDDEREQASRFAE